MRRRLEPPGTFNVWPAFTDVLGGLVVVLIFLITVFVIGEVLIGREISGKENAIGQLGDIVAHIENLLGASEKNNLELQARVGALESRLTEREREAEGLRDDMSRAERARSRLEQELALVGEERQRLRSDLESRTEAYSELVAAKATVDLESAESERQVATLNSRLDELARELERLNRALAGNEEKLAASVTALQEKEHALGEAEQRVERLQTSSEAELTQRAELIEEQRGRIEELDRLIKSRLVDRVEELEQYSSDFFGRLRQVFADNPDIKVEGDRFVFQSEVLFPSGQALLSTGGEGDLDKFVEVYRTLEAKIPKDLPVIIEIQGHTDRVPISTSRFRSNWELSAQRALGVVNYMIDKGVPPERLAAVGMGEYHPIDTSDSPTAYRRNRRIELKITSR